MMFGYFGKKHDHFRSKLLSHYCSQSRPKSYSSFSEFLYLHIDCPLASFPASLPDLPQDYPHAGFSHLRLHAVGWIHPVPSVLGLNQPNGQRVVQRQNAGMPALPGRPRTSLPPPGWDYQKLLQQGHLTKPAGNLQASHSQQEEKKIK